MLIKFMNKGQSLLSLVMWITGISVAVGGSVYGVVSTKFTKVDDRINMVQVQTSAIDTRTAVIENAIIQIKEDNKEMKVDLKELLKRK
jgi:hypothetical protein